MSGTPPPWDHAATPMLVVTRYRVAEDDATAFRTAALAALDALGRQPGLLAAQLGRATDDPGRWVLTLTWASVGHYRRALSAYEVKVAAVPLLSLAVDEPTAHELLEGRGPLTVSAASALAPDAGQVRLGETSP